ncbi:MAG: DUF3750 domain-containing protein [Candidatus Rokuibacteriota bacterium]
MARRLGLGALAILVLVACAPTGRGEWWQARRDSSGQAPDPAATPEPVIQVYAARAVGWRGTLGVHTWVVVKRAGAPAFTRYEVIGWGVDRGAPAVRVDRAAPDAYWFGARPVVLADLRGEGVGELIERLEAAVASYPYNASYRLWPGPNSNTFTAHVGRAVPELRLDLPPTAIGKDFLTNGSLAAVTPGGRGVQLSLFGVAGLLVGVDEGLEVNLLGLTFGLDVMDPALKLPGVGRVGVP